MMNISCTVGSSLCLSNKLLIENDVPLFFKPTEGGLWRTHKFLNHHCAEWKLLFLLHPSLQKERKREARLGRKILMDELGASARPDRLNCQSDLWMNAIFAKRIFCCSMSPPTRQQGPSTVEDNLDAVTIQHSFRSRHDMWQRSK